MTDSLVHRYHTDGSDGFTEPEGTFNLCSFWYVEALTRAGRLDQARHTFEKMLTYANHLGPLRRGDRARPARRWATSRRPSPTWPSSARPSTSTGPWRHDRHVRAERRRPGPSRVGAGRGPPRVRGRRPARRRGARAARRWRRHSRPGARAAVGAPAQSRTPPVAAGSVTPHGCSPRPSPRRCPDFALLLRHRRALLVLVHGDVTVSVDGPEPADPQRRGVPDLAGAQGRRAVRRGHGHRPGRSGRDARGRCRSTSGRAPCPGGA